MSLEHGTDWDESPPLLMDDLRLKHDEVYLQNKKWAQRRNASCQPVSRLSGLWMVILTYCRIRGLGAKRKIWLNSKKNNNNYYYWISHYRQDVRLHHETGNWGKSITINRNWSSLVMFCCSCCVAVSSSCFHSVFFSSNEWSYSRRLMCFLSCRRLW